MSVATAYSAQRLQAAKLPAIPGIPDPSKAAGSGANPISGQKDGGQKDETGGGGTAKDAKDTKEEETARAAELLTLAAEFEARVRADHAQAV